MNCIIIISTGPIREEIFYEIKICIFIVKSREMPFRHTLEADSQDILIDLVGEIWGETLIFLFALTCFFCPLVFVRGVVDDNI